MKKVMVRAIKSQVTLLAAFVVSAAVAYLLVAQFQGTILQAWIGTTTESADVRN